MTTTSSPEAGLAGPHAEPHCEDATSLHTPRTRTDIRVRGARHARRHGADGPSTRRTHDLTVQEARPVEEFVTDAPDTGGRAHARDVAS
jgi:hypothetical protein